MSASILQDRESVEKAKKRKMQRVPWVSYPLEPEMAKESRVYFDDGVMDTRVTQNLRSIAEECCSPASV